LKPFSIRNINIDPPLILAPMSGVTCSAFRRLIKRLNPGAIGLVASEFLSVEGMTRSGRRTLEMMKFREEERPLSIQIFGRNIHRMRDAARMIEDTGADIVDINCGCPAPKVVKKGGGCVLMLEPELLAQIIREIRAAISIPLTIKIRSGWDSANLNAFEIAKIAESEGVDSVTIHGRTRSQMYQGEADWEIVERVADALRVPVCGSGDIKDRETALSRLKGAIAGLYIGRAALSNPYVFREIVNREAFNIRRDQVSAINLIRQYIELLLEDMPERGVIGHVKQLIGQIAPRRWEWKTIALRAQNLEGLLEVLSAATAQPSKVHDAAALLLNTKIG